MGDGAIPFTAVVEYSTIMEVEDFDEFLYVIRRIDDLIMKRRANDGQRNTKDNNKVRR